MGRTSFIVVPFQVCPNLSKLIVLWGSRWDKGKNQRPSLLFFILFLKFETFKKNWKFIYFPYGVGIEYHLCQGVFEQEGYTCRTFQPIYKWKFLKGWGQVKWRFKVLARWSGLGFIKNDRPYIFINSKATIGITTKVQCQDDTHGLLWSNFISSPYHSHPLYFASTNMLTFTWYVSTLYPLIASSPTSYFAPNCVHGGPPFSHLCVLCPICNCFYKTKAWLTCH
jgi:hypothetical protein